MTLLATLLYGAAISAQPYSLPASAQLPDWATPRWQKLSRANSLQISTAINPFLLRGDFDGDARSDIAFLVRSKTSKKLGIVIMHRGGPAHVLGAGKDFGNGGDDFSWVDIWQVEDKGTHQSGGYDKPLKLGADGLLLAKAGSASGLVYFKGGKYHWQQQGD